MKGQAESGNVHAQQILGYIYWIGGDDVAKDDEEAAEWFHKAADQGCKSSQYYLGHIYSNDGKFRGTMRRPLSGFAKRLTRRLVMLNIT